MIHDHLQPPHNSFIYILHVIVEDEEEGEEEEEETSCEDYLIS